MTTKRSRVPGQSRRARGQRGTGSLPTRRRGWRGCAPRRSRPTRLPPCRTTTTLTALVVTLTPPRGKPTATPPPSRPTTPSILPASATAPVATPWPQRGGARGRSTATATRLAASSGTAGSTLSHLPTSEEPPSTTARPEPWSRKLSLPPCPLWGSGRRWPEPQERRGFFVMGSAPPLG